MEINPKKAIFLIIFVLTLLLLIGGGIYFYSISLHKSKQIERRPKDLSHNPCLLDNEVMKYEIVEEKDGSKSVIISIYNEDQTTKKFSFRVGNFSGPYKRSAFKCNIYIVREFNVDYIKGVPLKDYREELWVYHYDGTGEFLMTLFRGEGELDNFGSLFSIDPFEKYITLERSYLGNPNYALVIKRLDTKEDIFVLPLKEITNKYPTLEGSIGFNEWTKDGRYFWGNISYGANVLAFFRIDTTNWSYEVFPAPKDVLGGDALNVETGYITVHPGNVWFGIAEITEEEKERRRKEGIGTELYIENLITKEKHFVDKTDEPLWYFKPKWISDTELEYYLPSGERKIYKIQPK
jgi:hypothetical protein